MQAVADRRQRVAQLVGESGKELVLAEVGFRQHLLGAFQLGNVLDDSTAADDVPVGITQRRGTHAHPMLVTRSVRIKHLDAGHDRFTAQRAVARPVLRFNRIAALVPCLPVSDAIWQRRRNGRRHVALHH